MGSRNGRYFSMFMCLWQWNAVEENLMVEHGQKGTCAGTYFWVVEKMRCTSRFPQMRQRQLVHKEGKQQTKIQMLVDFVDGENVKFSSDCFSSVNGIWNSHWLLIKSGEDRVLEVSEESNMMWNTYPNERWVEGYGNLVGLLSHTENSLKVSHHVSNVRPVSMTLFLQPHLFFMSVKCRGAKSKI